MSIRDSAINWSKDIYKNPLEMTGGQRIKLGLTVLAVFVGIYFAATIFSTVVASIVIVAGLALLGASIYGLSSQTKRLKDGRGAGEGKGENWLKNGRMGFRLGLGLVAIALAAVAVATLAPAYVPASLIAYKVTILVSALIAGTLLLAAGRNNGSDATTSGFDFTRSDAKPGWSRARLFTLFSLACIAGAFIAAAYIPAGVAAYGSTAGSYAANAANAATGAYAYTTGTLFPMITSGLLMALGLSIAVAVFVNRQVNKLVAVKEKAIEAKTASKQSEVDVRQGMLTFMEKSREESRVADASFSTSVQSQANRVADASFSTSVQSQANNGEFDSQTQIPRSTV